MLRTYDGKPGRVPGGGERSGTAGDRCGRLPGPERLAIPAGAPCGGCAGGARRTAGQTTQPAHAPGDAVRREEARRRCLGCLRPEGGPGSAPDYRSAGNEGSQEATREVEEADRLDTARRRNRLRRSGISFAQRAWRKHPKNCWGGCLKEVSRSFYLTLRVLPGKVRAPNWPGLSAGAHNRHHRRHRTGRAGAAA